MNSLQMNIAKKIMKKGYKVRLENNWMKCKSKMTTLQKNKCSRKITLNKISIWHN